MNVSTLPAILDVSTTAAIAAVVSGLLALFAPLLSAVPGLRPQDSTRSTLLRVLLFALNLGLLIGLAWTQNVIIPREMLPALLVAAGGASLGGHVFYTGVAKSGGASTSAAPAVTPDALALATEAVAAAQAVSAPAA